MIGQLGFHCRSNAQSLVNPAEILVHEIQGLGSTMILDLL
jgi:hypothetical protein